MITFFMFKKKIFIKKKFYSHNSNFFLRPSPVIVTHFCEKDMYLLEIRSFVKNYCNIEDIRLSINNFYKIKVHTTTSVDKIL